MLSRTAPDCFDVLSTENFLELQDELCKRGVMESYQQRHQRQLAAVCKESFLDRYGGPPTARALLHKPALSSPSINGNCTMVAAQVYVKSIIEKLAKDSAHDERLVRDFIPSMAKPRPPHHFQPPSTLNQQIPSMNGRSISDIAYSHAWSLVSFPVACAALWLIRIVRK